MSKNLCDKKEVKKDKSAKYECKKCRLLAASDKHLCDPKKIKKKE
jgi:hypothetical protein